ncbi:hypothetical protein HK100_011446, partial [Physocladia obscura]
MENNRFIKKTKKVVKQLQMGGMEIEHNILKRRSAEDTVESRKKARLEMKQNALKRQQAQIASDG